MPMYQQPPVHMQSMQNRPSEYHFTPKEKIYKNEDGTSVLDISLPKKGDKNKDYIIKYSNNAEITSAADTNTKLSEKKLEDSKVYLHTEGDKKEIHITNVKPYSEEGEYRLTFTFVNGNQNIQQVPMPQPAQPVQRPPSIPQQNVQPPLRQNKDQLAEQQIMQQQKLEQERLMKEQQEKEGLARQQQEQERLIREQAEKERLAMEQQQGDISQSQTNQTIGTKQINEQYEEDDDEYDDDPY